MFTKRHYITTQLYSPWLSFRQATAAAARNPKTASQMLVANTADFRSEMCCVIDNFFACLMLGMCVIDNLLLGLYVIDLLLWFILYLLWRVWAVYYRTHYRSVCDLITLRAVQIKNNWLSVEVSQILCIPVNEFFFQLVRKRFTSHAKIALDAQILP